MPFLLLMLTVPLLAGASAGVSPPEMELLAAVVLGWGLQVAKGPKKIPTWIAYVGVGILATALFVWMTPDFSLAPDLWRGTVAGWLTFIMSARGLGSTARDAKVAPATNSL